jgi:hypothetical protein
MKKLFLILLLLISFNNLNAQTIITPVRYWTFNTSSPTADSTNNGILNLSAYGGQFTVQSGPVGKSITLTETGNYITSSGTFVINNGITVEFLFKPGPKFNNQQTNFFAGTNGVFSISWNYPSLTFNTKHKNTSGVDISDSFTIQLNELGRKSYGYYTDGNWHHMVFKFNATTGVKEIWVDGQLPAGFSKTITAGSYNNQSISLGLSSTVDYARYYGSLDEIAIYNTAIPASLIYKHYLGFLNGQSYSYTNDFTGIIPPPLPVTGPLDVLEFAPGHILGQVTSGISTGVNRLPTEQLNSFALPRYKTNHTMRRNLNWMDMDYMGGQFQTWSPNQLSVATYGGQVVNELSKNYNYALSIAQSPNNVDHRDTTRVGLANRNPNIPLMLVTFRGVGGGMTNQNRPNSYYLQNSSGQFLDQNGNVTTNKIWRPTAPDIDYVQDGNTLFSLLSRYNSPTTNPNIYLTRKINWINENGEYVPNIINSALAADPVVNTARINSGLSERAWFSRRLVENDKVAFSNIIKTHPTVDPSVVYTYYGLTQDPSGFYDWFEAKKYNTPINNQYYSTSDFYVRYPYNWKDWISAWHGLKWFTESRYTELQQGDKYFSPFVSAGWDSNEENNVRPAQWLGLLKIMSNLGAEFFYTGHFSLQSPWPDSRNWIWQAVAPSYAQAAFSRVEDLYKNSNILNGDVPASWVNPTRPAYQFNAGDVRKVINVRKHNTLNKYIITGTIQPHSSMQGNAELETNATITLDGQQVSFKIRRQGSVYVYDKTVTPAIFYQLDSWHESTHPWYWSKSFNIEAELFDNNITTTYKTENISNNYTTFTTGVNSTSTLEYNFNVRSQSTYYLWIRAKSIDGTNGLLNIGLDNQPIKTIGCINDTNWVWYSYELCSTNKIQYQNITTGLHTLKITPSNNKIYLDIITLSTESTYSPTPQSSLCGGGTATITPSGSTTICNGESITLTANSGSSYLWSTGSTSQSINVSQAGSYIVTVFNGACSATSLPTNIIVNTPPQATISTSGSTTICQGSSVILTASSGSSYLWSNGLTTQSITVTTAGSYYVTIINNGCLSTSTVVDVIVNACPTGCPIPTGLTSVNVGASSATISWTLVPLATSGYTVKVRNLKTKTNTFYQISAGVTNLTFTVNPSTNYRWFIRSKCSNNTVSNYSQYVAFKTPSSRVASTFIGSEMTNEELQTFQANLLVESNIPNMSSSDFELYPNPAYSEVNVVYKSSTDSKITIELLDYKGKVVSKYTTNVFKGINNSIIDINNISRGLYMVKLKDNKTGTITKQLAIQ